MGQQIVKQPNGLYAIWSSVVDGFISVDNTPEEIVEEYVSGERSRIERRVNDVVSQLDANGKPYHQFTMTFAECLERINEIHGPSRVDEIMMLMDSTN